MKKSYGLSLTLAICLLVSGAATGQNLLQGGDMESEDYWNVSLLNSDVDVTYEFGYTETTPAHGEGGALMVSSSVSGDEGDQLSNIVFYQEVTLEGGETYLFDGAFKDVDGLDQFWAEVSILQEAPEVGEDWGDHFSGFNTWGGCGDGVDGTFVEDGCEGDNLYTVEGEGEQTLYFGIKVGNGSWDAGVTRAFTVLIDEVSLTLADLDDVFEYDVTFNVDMAEAEDFDAANHDVYITGEMSGWAEPGSVPDHQMSPHEDLEDTYTITLTLQEDSYQYKYFFVPHDVDQTWDYDEWAGEPNRSITVSGDMEVYDVWGEQPEPTDVRQVTEVPGSFHLKQNYPNPFNPTTTIGFTLPESAHVSLEVFNIQGQHMATLLNSSLSAGSHHVNFNASELASGLYLYRLQAGDFVQTRKMQLVK